MEPFRRLTSKVIPLDRVNVDTDQIVPKQFLKLVERVGFGKYLFFDWRYDERGNPRRDFVLNQPEYKDAQLLLTRDNFGCGSSREHAVWALQDYGIRCIIAPSFADIFYSNCLKNGLLPITLPRGDVDHLFRQAYASPPYTLTVDLEAETILEPGGNALKFHVDPYKKKMLLEGLDDIAITLRLEEKIKEHEEKMLAFRRPAADFELRLQ